MQQDYLPVEVYEALGICWENFKNVLTDVLPRHPSAIEVHMGRAQTKKRQLI